MTNAPTIKYGGFLIAEGEKFTIIAAVLDSGNCPFWEYFEKLNNDYNRILKKGGSKNNKTCKDYGTLSHYFDKFCDHGSWSNKDQLRSLGNGFFEFKNIDTGLRVPFYYDESNQSVIVLTHYFEKKEQRTKKKHLERMASIKTAFEKKRSQGGN